MAAVAVPEGKVLQKLEFYSNESRVATLYQAPYEQTVNVKQSGSLGYVLAGAGAVTRETSEVGSSKSPNRRACVGQASTQAG